MSKLPNTARRELGTEASIKYIPDGPVLCMGRYVVRHNDKIVLDERRRWKTFDTLAEADRFYTELKGNK